MSVWLSTCLAIFFACSTCASSASLTVAAAADLSALTTELNNSFRKINPDATVRFVIGASGSLARQIENGAPYDVFLSANEAYVDQLATAGRLSPNSASVYALGQVAVLWKDGKRHSLTDLQQPWVRLFALPNPKLAPYGAAAQQALTKAGLWDKISDKAVYGENVRQTLEIFQSGNADAVLTSYTVIPEGELLPFKLYDRIRQKGAMVAATKNPEGAKAFLAFIKSDAGQQVFRRHGLLPPPTQ